MVSELKADPRIIVALDFDTADKALALVSQLSPEQCRLKVGKELFVTAGPALVEKLVADGFDVFLDLKFHDIPNTVAKACQAAAKLGVWMMNVHASGGEAMMSAAREAIETGSHRPLLIAVTILTSMSQSALEAIGFGGTVEENVQSLALSAKSAGMDGVVCSPREVATLKQACGSDFVLVTPGVRPKSSAMDDQHRVMTPADAIRAGSHYLVVGRPITQAEDPPRALAAIIKEINSL